MQMLLILSVLYMFTILMLTLLLFCRWRFSQSTALRLMTVSSRFKDRFSFKSSSKDCFSFISSLKRLIVGYKSQMSFAVVSIKIPHPLSSQKIILFNFLSIPLQVIALSVVGLVVVVVAMVIMLRTLGTMILHQVSQIESRKLKVEK